MNTSYCSELWEKKPLLVKRHMPNYNDGWFSTVELDKVMREVIMRRHLCCATVVAIGLSVVRLIYTLTTSMIHLRRELMTYEVAPEYIGERSWPSG